MNMLLFTQNLYRSYAMRFIRMLAILALLAGVADSAEAQGKGIHTSRRRVVTRTVQAPMDPAVADSIAGVRIICGIIKDIRWDNYRQMPSVHFTMASGNNYGLLGTIERPVAMEKRHVIRFVTPDWTSKDLRVPGVTGIILSMKPVDNCDNYTSK